MNDWNLLILAAKAADMVISDHIGPDYDYFMDGATGKEWNPLTDDGDALRLAVKLDMQVTVNRVDEWTEVVSGYYGENRVRERHESDMYAATRRSIVRAAAEIGRKL